jgi:hypothetical protein
MINVPLYEGGAQKVGNVALNMLPLKFVFDCVVLACDINCMLTVHMPNVPPWTVPGVNDFFSPY